MLLLQVLKNLLASDIGRRHPLQVMARFGYWQVRRRVWPQPFHFQTPTGTRVTVEPRGDFMGVTPLFYFGFPNLEETAFACHAMRPGEVFWDIGANQGFWSLLLAGRGIEAHAFEPTPTTFRDQAKQFAGQSPCYRDRLHGHNIALASSPGTMRFTIDRGLGNSLLKEEDAYAGEVGQVEVTTVDEFCTRAPAPHFVKIDVEGWTLPVLEGATATLARSDLLGLVIETFRPADGAKPEMRQVESILADHGFGPFSYDVVSRRLRRLTKLNEGRQDTIYARDDEPLRERLRTSEPIACFGERF